MFTIQQDQCDRSATEIPPFEVELQETAPSGSEAVTSETDPIGYDDERFETPQEQPPEVPYADEEY